MNILIGYSMRSGSTLLQHILHQHSRIRSFSDVSSFFAITGLVLRYRFKKHVCVKPVDLLFLSRRIPFLELFDKKIWLTRDPRDSYLSTIESGYAYLFWWRRRRIRKGIDTGLLRRWKRIHRHYFADPGAWHLMRYEDLVHHPDDTLGKLLDYLELPEEALLPFRPFDMKSGGDYKIRNTSNVKKKSVNRHRLQLDDSQRLVFEKMLGGEMRALGYVEDEEAGQPQPQPAAAG